MKRIKLVFLAFSLGLVLVVARLFYWQIIKAEALVNLAQQQHSSALTVAAPRGQILAVDGFPLVTNQPAFLAFLEKQYLKVPAADLVEAMAPFLLEPEEATLSGQERQLVLETRETNLLKRITNPEVVWVPLGRDLDLETKQNLEALGFEGLSFQEGQQRFYPEASMAAHFLGFVGKDEQGENQGYFGLEGFYNLDLSGRPGLLRREKDALGRPIILGDFYEVPPKNGSHLELFIDRGVQFMVEEELKLALERYGAKSGSVTIMEPETGAILAMASLPAYDPGQYNRANPASFKNPVVAETYEPGSTFKTLVMASALDADVIERQDQCDQCSGPREIGPYTIRTWDNNYYPDSTMDEILIHSDNVGMVFVGEKLGLDKLLDYLHQFGFEAKTGIDLQEELAPSLKPDNKWGQIGLATASFGQGIAVTRIQMLRAVAALANQGRLVEPRLVAKIKDEDKLIELQSKVIRQVIKPETARIITDMMVRAVKDGEAKWAVPKGYKIAGKTGTSQIPIKGQYDDEKTITSFVGFAPADRPKFVMLVTLREPTSSPWGSETAAPLFFRITQKLFLYFNIPPG